MGVEIVIPRLGWTMESGVFLRWLKLEGETVQAGDPLFELEGEKAIQEVEATDAGVLRISPRAPESGATVAVGTLLGFIAAAGETPNWDAVVSSPPASSAQPAAKSAPDSVTTAETPPAAPSVRRLARSMGVNLSQVVPADPAGRVSAGDLQGAFRSGAASQAAKQPTRSAATATSQVSSPRARRVARELGIDWTQVAGSGRNGRVRERDVRALGVSAQQTMAGSSGDVALPGRIVPITRFRRTIAERMVAGVQVAAPVTITATADAGALVALRTRLKGEAGSAAPTYNDLLIKLTAAALQKHPLLNAQWREQGILIPDQVHIALAVQTEDGLVAPVIRDVPGLSLTELATRSQELIEKALQRRLAVEHLQGGTFTVTNLGSFGIEFFTPIINLPQCAILGIGQIRREPVIHAEKIIPSERLPLSLTFDHRLIDGAPAAQFLQSLCNLIAEPATVLGCL